MKSRWRYDQSLLLLWLFLIFQIVVLFCYLKFSSSWNNTLSKFSGALPVTIKFLKQPTKNQEKLVETQKYYDAEAGNEILLKTEYVEDYFWTDNNTICFNFGTNLDYMKRNVENVQKKEKCECLPGYHGNHCSLPEVIWRAFIALRQETVIHKRKTKARRIIHMFLISHPAQISLAVIKINELFEVVDLFIVVETNRSEHGEEKPFYFKKKLEQGFLKEQQYKILHSPVYLGENDNSFALKRLWEKVKKLIKNLESDDLFFELDNSVIPNPKALLFFKLFDGFSLPLEFRVKWNVFGYFYQHPNKTKLIKTGCTIKMLEEVFNNELEVMNKAKGLVVGDLNHYGGWYCEFCYAFKDLLDVMQYFKKFDKYLPKTSKGLYVKYLEDLVEKGIYVDGSTGLLPNTEGIDHYYAPDFVSENYWKYDYLMINFLSKSEY